MTHLSHFKTQFQIIAVNQEDLHSNANWPQQHFPKSNRLQMIVLLFDLNPWCLPDSLKLSDWSGVRILPQMGGVQLTRCLFIFITLFL